MHAVHLEKSDQFQVSTDKHTITFFFKNYGAIDGVDFATHCAPSIKFALQSDGHTSPTSKIVIGKGLGPQFEEPARQIVGIVGNVRENGLSNAGIGVMYVPQSQVADARLITSRAEAKANQFTIGSVER